MDLKESLKNAYLALEDKYYAFLDYLEENLHLPVYKYLVEPIESRGVPSFPVYSLLLFALVAGAFLLLAQPGTAKLVVNVVDLNNDPVSGASLTLYTNKIIDSSIESRTLTSSDGVAYFAGVPKNAKLMLFVSAKGFKDQNVTMSLNPEKAETKQTIELEKKEAGVSLDTASATVKVFSNDSGDGVPGALVSFEDEKGNKDSVTADAYGVAELTFSSESTSVSFTVTADGFEDYSGEVKAKATVTVKLSQKQVQKDYGSVAVTVVDDLGDPARAYVTLQNALSQRPVDSMKTDSNGQVVFEQVPAGTVVYVSAIPDDTSFQNYLDEGKQETVYAGEPTEFRVELKKKAPGSTRDVSVEVSSNEDGSLLSGATVNLFFPTQNVKSADSPKDADEEGKAVFTIPRDSGVYVTAFKEGFLPDQKPVAPSETQVSMTLKPAVSGNNGELRVTVTDFQGNYVPGAIVDLYTQNDYFLGMPSQVADETGTAIFEGVPFNTAIKARGSANGLDGETLFTMQGDKEVTVKLAEPKGTLVVSLKNLITKSLIAGSVGAFLDNVQVANCTTTASAPCSLQVRADSQVTLKASATGFIDSTSSGISVSLNQSQALEIGLLSESESKNFFIDLIGLRRENDEQFRNVSGVDRGTVYEAQFAVNIPGNGTSKSGFYLRLGDKETLADEPAFLELENDAIPAGVAVTRGVAFHPGPSCTDDTDKEAAQLKWFNFEFQKGEFGLRNFFVKVRVKPDATAKQVMTLRYRAYAQKGDVFIHYPTDSQLGTLEKTDSIDSCYAEAFKRDFSVIEGNTACNENACASVSFEQGGVARKKGFSADLNSNFTTKFEIRTFSQVNTPVLKIWSEGNFAKFFQYTTSDSISGNAGGVSNFSFALSGLTENDFLSGRVFTKAAIPSRFAKISFSLVDGETGEEVVSGNSYLMIQGTALMSVEISPREIVVNEPKDITVRVSSAGLPVTDAQIQLLEGGGLPFGGQKYEFDKPEDYGTDGVYVLRDINAVHPGTIRVLVTKEFFRDYNDSVTALQSDFLSTESDGTQLSCDGSSVTVSNSLNYPVKVLATTDCANILGEGVTIVSPLPSPTGTPTPVPTGTPTPSGNPTPNPAASVQLYLNGVRANAQLTAGSSLTALANSTVTGVTPALYLNNSIVANPYANSSLLPGFYVFLANATNPSTGLTASESWSATVTLPQQTFLKLLLNGAEANLSYSYNPFAFLIVNATSDFTPIVLTMDGAAIANPSNLSLAARDTPYKFEASTTGNATRAPEYKVFYANVSKASPQIALYYNGQQQTAQNPVLTASPSIGFNASANVSSAQARAQGVTPILYFNNAQGINPAINFNPVNGTYPIVAGTLGNQNYSPENYSATVIVGIVPSNLRLFLNGTRGSRQVVQGTPFNFTAVTEPGLAVVIKMNGTIIAAGGTGYASNQTPTLALGYWNITAVTNGNSNHWPAVENWMLKAASDAGTPLASATNQNSLARMTSLYFDTSPAITDYSYLSPTTKRTFQFTVPARGDGVTVSVSPTVQKQVCTVRFAAAFGASTSKQDYAASVACTNLPLFCRVDADCKNSLYKCNAANYCELSIVLNEVPNQVKLELDNDGIATAKYSLKKLLSSGLSTLPTITGCSISNTQGKVKEFVKVQCDDISKVVKIDADFSDHPKVSQQLDERGRLCVEVAGGESKCVKIQAAKDASYCSSNEDCKSGACKGGVCSKNKEPNCENPTKIVVDATGNNALTCSLERYTGGKYLSTCTVAGDSQFTQATKAVCDQTDVLSLTSDYKLVKGLSLYNFPAGGIKGTVAMLFTDGSTRSLDVRVTSNSDLSSLKIIAVSPKVQEAKAGDSVDLEVQVVDSNNNGASGVPVTFKIKSQPGTGAMCGGALSTVVTSGSKGSAKTSVTVGQTNGDVIVSAGNDDINSVEFKITVKGGSGSGGTIPGCEGCPPVDRECTTPNKCFNEVNPGSSSPLICTPASATSAQSGQSIYFSPLEFAGGSSYSISMKKVPGGSGACQLFIIKAFDEGGKPLDGVTVAFASGEGQVTTGTKAPGTVEASLGPVATRPITVVKDSGGSASGSAEFTLDKVGVVGKDICSHFAVEVTVTRGGSSLLASGTSAKWKLPSPDPAVCCTKAGKKLNADKTACESGSGGTDGLETGFDSPRLISIEVKKPSSGTKPELSVSKDKQELSEDEIPVELYVNPLVPSDAVPFSYSTSDYPTANLVASQDTNAKKCLELITIPDKKQLNTKTTVSKGSEFYFAVRAKSSCFKYSISQESNRALKTLLVDSQGDEIPDDGLNLGTITLSTGTGQSKKFTFTAIPEGGTQTQLGSNIGLVVTPLSENARVTWTLTSKPVVKPVFYVANNLQVPVTLSNEKGKGGSEIKAHTISKIQFPTPSSALFVRSPQLTQEFQGSFALKKTEYYLENSQDKLTKLGTWVFTGQIFAPIAAATTIPTTFQGYPMGTSLPNNFKTALFINREYSSTDKITFKVNNLKPIEQSIYLAIGGVAANDAGFKVGLSSNLEVEVSFGTDNKVVVKTKNPSESSFSIQSISSAQVTSFKGLLFYLGETLDVVFSDLKIISADNVETPIIILPTEMEFLTSKDVAGNLFEIGRGSVDDPYLSTAFPGTPNCIDYYCDSNEFNTAVSNHLQDCMQAFDGGTAGNFVMWNRYRYVKDGKMASLLEIPELKCLMPLKKAHGVKIDKPTSLRVTALRTLSGVVSTLDSEKGGVVYEEFTFDKVPEELKGITLNAKENKPLSWLGLPYASNGKHEATASLNAFNFNKAALGQPPSTTTGLASKPDELHLVTTGSSSDGGVENALLLVSTKPVYSVYSCKDGDYTKINQRCPGIGLTDSGNNGVIAILVSDTTKKIIVGVKYGKSSATGLQSGQKTLPKIARGIVAYLADELYETQDLAKRISTEAVSLPELSEKFVGSGCKLSSSATALNSLVITCDSEKLVHDATHHYTNSSALDQAQKCSNLCNDYSSSDYTKSLAKYISNLEFCSMHCIPVDLTNFPTSIVIKTPYKKVEVQEPSKYLSTYTKNNPSQASKWKLIKATNVNSDIKVPATGEESTDGSYNSVESSAQKLRFLGKKAVYLLPGFMSCDVQCDASGNDYKIEGTAKHGGRGTPCASSGEGLKVLRAVNNERALKIGVGKCFVAEKPRDGNSPAVLAPLDAIAGQKFWPCPPLKSTGLDTDKLKEWHALATTSAATNGETPESICLDQVAELSSTEWAAVLSCKAVAKADNGFDSAKILSWLEKSEQQTYSDSSAYVSALALVKNAFTGNTPVESCFKDDKGCGANLDKATETARDLADKWNHLSSKCFSRTSDLQNNLKNELLCACASDDITTREKVVDCFNSKAAASSNYPPITKTAVTTGLKDELDPSKPSGKAFDSSDTNLAAYRNCMNTVCKLDSKQPLTAWGKRGSKTDEENCLGVPELSVKPPLPDVNYVTGTARIVDYKVTVTCLKSNCGTVTAKLEVNPAYSAKFSIETTTAIQVVPSLAAGLTKEFSWKIRGTTSTVDGDDGKEVLELTLKSDKIKDSIPSYRPKAKKGGGVAGSPVVDATLDASSQALRDSNLVPWFKAMIYWCGQAPYPNSPLEPESSINIFSGLGLLNPSGTDQYNGKTMSGLRTSDRLDAGNRLGSWSDSRCGNQEWSGNNIPINYNYGLSKRGDTTLSQCYCIPHDDWLSVSYCPTDATDARRCSTVSKKFGNLNDDKNNRDKFCFFTASQCPSVTSEKFLNCRYGGSFNPPKGDSTCVAIREPLDSRMPTTLPTLPDASKVVVESTPSTDSTAPSIP